MAMGKAGRVCSIELKLAVCVGLNYAHFAYWTVCLLFGLFTYWTLCLLVISPTGHFAYYMNISPTSLNTSCCFRNPYVCIVVTRVRPICTSDIGNIGAKLNIGESVASVCRYVIDTLRFAFNKPHSPLSIITAMVERSA